MDSEATEESYPAISRALNLLRARLFAQQEDVHVNLEDESPSATDFVQSSIDEQVEKDKEDSTHKYNSIDLKQLAFKMATAHYSRGKCNNQKQASSAWEPVPKATLAKLSLLYSKATLHSYFESWKLRVQSRRNHLHCYRMVLDRLEISHTFWCRALPDSTKTNCIQRLGKLKLAALHAKISTKRRAMIEWIKYCLLNRKSGQVGSWGFALACAACPTRTLDCCTYCFNVIKKTRFLLFNVGLVTFLVAIRQVPHENDPIKFIAHTSIYNTTSWHINLLPACISAHENSIHCMYTEHAIHTLHFWPLF